MARNNKKRREWTKLARIMREAEAMIDRQIANNVSHPDTYGIYRKDPTAKEAIKNLHTSAAR